MRTIRLGTILCMAFSLLYNAHAQTKNRILFTQNWRFIVDSTHSYEAVDLNDNGWRLLHLPHDWSIEGRFDEHHPAGAGGGALPGGTGWYRKTFVLPAADKDKNIFIDFDGIYRNSEVWINNHYLGFRPNGYISFRYNLTPYVHFGNEKNVIAVKVDNSKQPNSRWYSGSGIYRNVWLVIAPKIHIDHWGTYVTTPQVNAQSATVVIKTKVANSGAANNGRLTTTIYTADGEAVVSKSVALSGNNEVTQSFVVNKPNLWSLERPYLYKVVSRVNNGKDVDEYETPLGIRYFNFDKDKGFSLNGKHIKINGVCNHHDLGALGAAINTRAIERQLEILKAMGCNA